MLQASAVDLTVGNRHEIEWFHVPATNDTDKYYPQSDEANQVFAISNCFQNLAHDMPNWSMTYCVGKTIQWVDYAVLSCLLSFLLALHCIMYKKINKRWSFRVLKRNRV